MGKSKKTGVPTKPRLRKDPGIPRLQNLAAKVQNAQKKSKSALNTYHDRDSTMDSEPTLPTQGLIAVSPSDEQDIGISAPSKTKEQIRKHHLHTLRKVVDESDIVILVLDARDPESCRSRLLEEEVRRREADGKKLVFVLNKIDLVHRSNAQAWLKYLRHSTPTLPFLSAAPRQRTNITSSTAPALLKLLKGCKPSVGSITIGVVGYPNVGKSSLINSLKRSKVCAVAAQPGHTKHLQHIQLERGIKIIDSPGVVFDDDFHGGKGSKKNNILLRNVVKVEDIEDPISVVEEILTRTSSGALQRIYNLPEFSSTLDFLTMLSMTSGRLLKGGAPDLNATARQVLNDWNQQKIPYFSDPPSLHSCMIPSTVVSTTRNGGTVTIAPGGENVGQAQILSEFSKSFELSGLFGDADAGAFASRVDAEDHPMGVADEDGEVFWDAVEDPEFISGDMDGIDDEQTEADDSKSTVLGKKRPRSPSELSLINSMTVPLEAASWHTRMPKRLRRSKEVPSYDAPPEEHVQLRMGNYNPLSRKVLKREAKRARKAHRLGKRRDDDEGLMDIDDGLEFTFMA